MEPKVTRLSPLLHELGAAMDAAGATFTSYAYPGISDDEIDELLAPTGLGVPTELREWWRWHHGSRVDVPLTGNHEIGPGGWGLMTIPQALDDRALWLEQMPSEEDGGWRLGWLPFAAGRFGHHRLVARLDESTDDELCVGISWVFDVPPDDPIERSLAAVVETWLRAIGDGYYTWNGVAWIRGARFRELPYYASYT